MNRKIYTVGQTNQIIGRLLGESPLLQSIAVSGEVSNLKYHQSGHIYFSLKDAGSALACVMFAGNRRGLGFRMKDGDKVIVSGQVQVYERNGSYQLYARKIELAGEGILYEAYLRLKKELEESGYFDPRYKKPIPRYARTVGVVTAPTGAAIRDIENIARRRNPYVQLYLYPAYVQGDGAKESIAQGIRALDGKVDLIIIGRGGGSLEDLWAFNERAVADAILECGTPIISAVGHETDTTIADFAADLRAPTPSAAAELAVFDYRKFTEDLNTLRTHFSHNMTARLQAARAKEELMESRLKLRSPTARLNGEKMRAAELEEKLGRLLRNRIEEAEARLARQRTELDAGMENALASSKQKYGGRRDALEALITKRLADSRHRLDLYVERFAGRNPLERLRQGYSFTETAGHRGVTSIDAVRPGDGLRIFVTDGVIEAEALRTERKSAGL